MTRTRIRSRRMTHPDVEREVRLALNQIGTVTMGDGAAFLAALADVGLHARAALVHARHADMTESEKERHVLCLECLHLRIETGSLDCERCGSERAMRPLAEVMDSVQTDDA